MECLSANGALRNNPFHPPNIADSKYLHFQIHHTENSSGLYGEDCTEFPNENTHKRYAKDLLLWRRKSCRQLIIDRLQSQTDEKIFNKPTSKVNPEFDLNGIYIDLALRDEAYPPMKTLIGRLHGAFASRVAKQMFSEIICVTTPEVFHLRGSSWSLGGAGFTVTLDGKLRPFRPPFSFEAFQRLLPKLAERFVHPQIVGSVRWKTKPEEQSSIVTVIDTQIRVTKDWLAFVLDNFKQKHEAYKLILVSQFIKHSDTMKIIHYDFAFPLDYRVDLILPFDAWMNDPALFKHLVLVEQDVFIQVQQIENVIFSLRNFIPRFLNFLELVFDSFAGLFI